MKVLFFASLRDEVGRPFVDLPASEFTVTNGAQLWEALGQVLEAAALLALRQENIRIAINQNMVDDQDNFAQQQLSDTDEVAFLPPVTGG